MFARSIPFLALIAQLAFAQAHAKDLALKIDYDSTAIGADGVTRTTRYSDKLIRRDNDSWFARVLPAHAHDEDEHAKGGKGHKHLDTTAAARWVTRQDDGKLQVRLVNTHEKMVVDIPKAEYSNIGFDGEWSTVSQLISTEQIKRMKVLSAPAPAGSRWYESRRGNLTVKVLWDERQEFPRKIESVAANGLYRSSVTATPQAMPATLPWSELKSFVRKEYTDFLD